MSERDDYLLDPKAPVDPAIAALENALRPVAWSGAPMRAMRPPVAAPRRVWPWLLAGALLVGALAPLFFDRERGLRPFAEARSFVAVDAPVRIPVSDLAEVTLRPGTRLDFLHWRKDELLFALSRGSIEARVAPPPKVAAGFFRVETKLGMVVDQGCRFVLEVRDDRSTTVTVTEGAIAFDGRDRSVFVPAGASADVDDGGVTTPVFADADRDLVKAVREFDILRQRGGSLDARGESVKMVLGAVRTARDSLVLWHMLRDSEPFVREVAEHRLLELVGPPDGGATKRSTFDPEEWLAHLRIGAWRSGG